MNHSQVRRRLRRELKELGASALIEYLRTRQGEPGLIAGLLNDRDQDIRMRTLVALGELDHPLLALAVRASVTDRSLCVRQAAIELLGQVGTRQDGFRLKSALEDPHWIVRSEAALSLSRTLGRAAINALMEAVTHDLHPVVRRDAALALARTGDKALSILLSERFDLERDPFAKAGLMIALYRLGQRERLFNIVEFMSHEDFIVRHNIVNSIADLPLASEQDRNQLIAALRELARSEENPGVREDAAKALKAIEQ
jgi:hypothetical protein